MATQTARVDLAKPYGGALSLTANGDIAIVTDAPGSPDATIQRIEHLIQTNPRLSDGNGGYLTRPDDLFNPDWGAGAGTVVGEMVSESLLSAIQARVIAALNTDPYIAPSPTVNVTDLGGGLVQIDISCETVTGQLVTVPSMQLNIF